MRRPGPRRKRDVAWAAWGGVLFLVHVLAAAGTLGVGIVDHELVDLWRVPALLAVYALEGWWLVVGCWRRTVWGAPDEDAIAEAAAPLTRRQRRTLAAFTLAGLVTVVAIVVAAAVQLWLAHHR